MTMRAALLNSMVAMATCAALFFLPASAHAAFIDWTSVSGGTIGSTTVTMSNLTSDPTLSLSNFELTGGPYAAAPGGAMQESLNYLGSDGWTATFGQPLSSVQLYAIFWRGDGGGVSPVRYTFDRSFSILSGFSGASISGNALSLPSGNLYEGILRFNGSFSSLSVTTNIPLDFQTGSGQAMTFNAVAVPEPASAIAAIVGLICLACMSFATYCKSTNAVRYRQFSGFVGWPL